MIYYILYTVLYLKVSIPMYGMVHMSYTVQYTIEAPQRVQYTSMETVPYQRVGALYRTYYENRYMILYRKP